MALHDRLWWNTVGRQLAPNRVFATSTNLWFVTPSTFHATRRQLCVAEQNRRCRTHWPEKYRVSLPLISGVEPMFCRCVDPYAESVNGPLRVGMPFREAFYGRA
jgi:hypothetical protein